MLNKLSPRQTILLACIVILALVLPAIINFINHTGKTVITIKTAPKGTMIFINGKKSKPGKVYLKPGEYTFVATFSGFKDDTQKFTVQKNTPSNIILLPTPNSVEALNYLKTHPQEQANREALGGERANEQGQAAIDKNPVVKILPFIDRNYRIDYGPSQDNPDDTTAIAITISSNSEPDKQAALDWLRFKGFDPAKLEIHYKALPGF